MSKIIYLDTETTGLDKEQNDIIQVAGIIEEALMIQGRTIEDIKTYPKPQDTYKEFIKILSKYVDKFNKNDKFYVAGQNVKFDLEFLHSWARKNGDVYLGSYFYWYALDLLVLASCFRAWGFIYSETLKLCDICKVLGVKIENAHDAMADIEATKACFEKIKPMMKYEPPQTETSDEEMPF